MKREKTNKKPSAKARIYIPILEARGYEICKEGKDYILYTGGTMFKLTDHVAKELLALGY